MGVRSVVDYSGSDALLVDNYSGEVIEVAYNVFY